MGASNLYLFVKSFIDLCSPVVLASLLTGMVIAILFPAYQSYTQWEGYGIYETYFTRIALKDLVVYSFQCLGGSLAAFLVLGSLIVFRMIGKSGVRSLARLRKTLIVLQVFIGCFFFFISLSLYKQVAFTQNKDKGIDIKNITQVDVGYYSGVDFDALGEELKRSPYIDDVTFTTTPILSELGDWYLSYIVSGLFFKGNPDEKIEANVFVVEPNFKDFFGIELQEGKWISNENEIVVNATQMQAFEGKNPLQNPLQRGSSGEEWIICGVIRDYYYSTMQYPVKGLFFLLQRKQEVLTPYQYVYIKTKPENHDKAILHLKTVLENVKTGEVAPGKQIIELQDIQNEFNKPERTLFRIFGFLSVICILVVSFGIYSLVTLTIEQRKKEIAIRKINGAEIRDILVLFIRSYLLLIVAGNVLALPVAYFFINRWLENYVYRTTLSWWLFALVFVTTCLIVLLSIFEKVRAAAKENPAEVVKSE
jgi:ABC-type antimicrobial peptide transport system permease subunit